MATTLPSLSSRDSVDGLASVTVMRFSFSSMSLRGAEQVGRNHLVDQEVVAAGSGLAQGLGPADDFHDLGGDRVLAGAVHHTGEVLDEVFGVVGRGLHRALT